MLLLKWIFSLTACVFLEQLHVVTAYCPDGCVCNTKSLICHGWRNKNPPHVSDTDEYEFLDLSSDNDPETLGIGCNNEEACVGDAGQAGAARGLLGEALAAGRLPAEWLGSGRFGLLRHLVLRRAGLRLLHKDAFRYQQKLLSVDLSANVLARINVFTWLHHPDLRVLFLTDNYGLEIPSDGPMLYSKSLEVLNMSGCGITTLHMSAFDEIPNLKELNLSNNNISTITTLNELNIPHELKYVDLSSNRMSYLSLDVIEILVYISEVNIDNNTWECGCQLKESWMAIRNINSSNALKTSQLMCSSTKLSWDEVFGSMVCDESSTVKSSPMSINFEPTEHAVLINESFVTNETTNEMRSATLFANTLQNCTFPIVTLVLLLLQLLLITTFTCITLKKKKKKKNKYGSQKEGEEECLPTEEISRLQHRSLLSESDL